MSFAARLKIAFGLEDPTAITCKFDEGMAALVDEFRGERQQDLAALIEQSSDRAALLSRATSEVQEWRLYARALERICLQHGHKLPRAPDE